MGTSATKFRFSLSAQAMQPSEVRRMMGVLAKAPDVISLAPGQIGSDTLPLSGLQALASQVAGAGEAAFQYIPTRGTADTIEMIGALCRDRGIESEVDERTMTQGAQQALDLVARILLDPGDVVLVEQPTYVGAIAAYRAARSEMVGVPLEPDGPDLEALRRAHEASSAAGKPPKFFYTIPNFQNPSGITMSEAKREALMALAEELDLLIVEDDPYGEIYFEEPPPASLKSRDRSGRVVYLGSFSKVLAPGLRSGFVIADSEFVGKIELGRQAADACGSALLQSIVLAAYTSGVYQKQLGPIRETLQRKFQAMNSALEREMPKGVEWTRPTGGLFVWLTLPEPLDARSLLELAIGEGVGYCAGAPFVVGQDSPRTLRLSFSKESLENIDTAISRLASVIRSAMA